MSCNADSLLSPFPFEKLPPEIRNEIYALAALDVKTKWGPHFRGVKQPNLLLCTKQTRTEGLPVFYRKHHFQIWLRKEHTFSGGILEHVLLWLKNIGKIGTQNIRHLHIDGVFRLKDKSIMDRLHRKLSDEAEVVWSSNVANATKQGRSCSMLVKIHEAYQDESLRVPKLQRSLRMGREFGLLSTCLIFPPGHGWFGH